jgi:hypothetical protein
LQYGAFISLLLATGMDASVSVVSSSEIPSESESGRPHGPIVQVYRHRQNDSLGSCPFDQNATPLSDLNGNLDVFFDKTRDSWVSSAFEATATSSRLSQFPFS